MTEDVNSLMFYLHALRVLHGETIFTMKSMKDMKLKMWSRIGKS